jgi:DNA-binding NarL/FixJ family response regulator
MSEKTQILVVDNQPLFRLGTTQWLNGQPDLVCCGEADNTSDARAAVASLRPDLVLLELQLADGDGLDLLRELSGANAAVRVIVLSLLDEQIYAHRAVRAGARGYVMKTETLETIKSAIRAVLSGEVYLSRPVAAQMLRLLFPDQASPTPDLARLTDRELQVFQLLGCRRTSHEIAQRLHLSTRTVDTHREHLKVKLALPDAHALLSAAIRWVEKGRLK